MLWQQVMSLSATSAKTMRSNNGLVKTQPTLLFLPVFSHLNFNWRFGNCLLHNAVVGGNLARHIEYLGRKYGEVVVKSKLIVCCTEN